MGCRDVSSVDGAGERRGERGKKRGEWARGKSVTIIVVENSGKAYG